ncbi:serine hydrolase [Vibrio sp. SCSIO 43136]|uniref:serine hydrolase domain-containing protein n=1 Tax=Vibrio sp. SCSIO 43136 TaxID=2819101 RepID=UPI002074E514|nr:serine hydrolase [Vibrio sp. SCSIO 43136]USD67422.1 serine hydrolase [Vibrio sp. SCSIO 43136]
MKKTIIAVAVALSTTFAAQAATDKVTFHSEDKAMLERVAALGISQSNWDSNEFASMFFIEPQRVSEHAVMQKSSNPRTFDKSEKSIDLNSIMVQDVDGWELSLNDLLRDRMHNRSMVILQDGKLVHEHYWSGITKNTKQLTMSAAKSFTSSLAGIAEAEGYFKFTDNVEKWLPEAKGTVIGAYPIQYVSDMRSGFALIDDAKNVYGDDWDTSMEHAISWKGHTDSEWVGIKDYTPHLTKLAYEQGKKYEYHSYNTEALGLITQRAVGKHWTEYFQEKLWDKGQFTSDTSIMVDKEGTVIACGSMGMTTRDFANMGDIWAHDGKSQNGTQVVPKAWLDNVWAGNDEVRAAWAKGKEAPLADGFYKDQFRVLNLGGEEWLLAIGVNGQVIAVEKESKTVIAMMGNYNLPSDARWAVDVLHMAVPTIKANIK